MTFELPIWMDNGGTYSAQADRHVIGAILSNPGVMGPTDLKVSERAIGANQSVDIAIGKAILPEGTSGRNYLARLTGSTLNLPLDPPPATNSRYDTIYAEVRDSTVSGSDDDWIIDFVEGTSAVSPSIPALPNTRCIRLANILRTAGDATISAGEITDARDVVWGWGTFTPLWLGSTVNPTIGSDGILVGRYTYVGYKRIRAEWRAQFGTSGSGAARGSGYYSWTLPKQASNNQVNVYSSLVGGCWCRRLSIPGLQRVGNVRLLTADLVEISFGDIMNGTADTVAYADGVPFLTTGHVGWDFQSRAEFWAEYEIA